MEMEVELLKKQHFDNYKNAMIENIKKNTSTLVDEDIMLLLKKPPLETMDLIKVKFLDISKKNKSIINTKSLDEIVENYRNNLIQCLKEIKVIREKELTEKVDKYVYLNDNNVFKLTKKDFVSINKKNKNLLKQSLLSALDQEIFTKMDNVFKEEDEDLKKKMFDEIVKYLKGTYQRQILNSVEFKEIVKDTTLINSIREQGERYLFTLRNSRLLKEDLEK